MLWNNLLHVFGALNRYQTDGASKSVTGIPLESFTYPQEFQYALDHLPDPNTTMRYSDYPPFGKVRVPEMTRAEFFARSIAVATYSIDNYVLAADFSGLILSRVHRRYTTEQERGTQHAICISKEEQKIAEKLFVAAVKRDMDHLKAKVFIYRLEWALHKWESGSDNYGSEDAFLASQPHLQLKYVTEPYPISYRYQVPPYNPAR